MKYCREMFLKFPPLDSVSESQLLEETPKAIDDVETQKKGKKSRRRNKHNKDASPDDSLNWITEYEESSDEGPLPRTRRRRRKYRAEEEETQFTVMKMIYDTQSQEVKNVINDLYKLHLKKQRRAARFKTSRLLLARKPKRIPINPQSDPKIISDCLQTTNVGFSCNLKILARLQRRRRNHGKPRSKRNCHKKFPRRRRRVNAKKGNRQGRKRYLRSQKLFDKGIFIVGGKLLDDVWKAVKDPNATSTTFCNNNIHGLSKIHKKQIELYEKIEDDLNRLNAARQERAEAAIERKAKEQEKEANLKGFFKNKIEARAAERAEQDSLRKQRRTARKQKVLEKKIKREKAKYEEFILPIAAV